MELHFYKESHEELVNNYGLLVRKYNKKGLDSAMDIINVINILVAADSLADIPNAYRPHPPKGGYKGYFAVDVDNIHRVIFKPVNNGF